MKMPNKYEIASCHQARRRDCLRSSERHRLQISSAVEFRVVGIIFSGIPSPFKADSNTVCRVSRLLSPKRFVS